MTTRTTKILVVDDEPAMREVLKARLEDWHFDVIVASGGQEALQVMRSSSPDIVLADVVLLDMSGHELLDLLKPESDDLPVITILMTAYGTIATAVDAMKRGAWDFLAARTEVTEARGALDAQEERVLRLQREIERRDARVTQLERELERLKQIDLRRRPRE